MNILHIAPHYGGGVGSVAVDLARVLKKNHGVVNRFISIDQPLNSLPQYLENLSFEFFGGLFFSFDKYSSLISEADVVLIHYWNHPLLSYLLAAFEFPACRVIFWTHNSGLHEPHLIPDWLFKSEFKVVFSSSASLKLFRDRAIRLPDNVHSIHSVRDLSAFTSAYSQRTYDSVSRLLYIGTVSRQKMHEESAYIINSLASQSFCIDIVGSVDDSELYEGLRSNPRIRFHGRQRDVIRYLLSNNLFIYPLNERHYGTGEQVILEAMATGMPVICLNNPCEMAIISHDKNGLLADCPNEFIQMVLKLSVDVPRCARIGKESHSDLLSRFSISSSAAQFFKLFEQIVAEDSYLWNGKILDLNHSDLPYAAMLLSSFVNHDAYWYYSIGNYYKSILVAEQQYRSVLSNTASLRNSSKASPFHYHKYFPSSAQISKLCSRLH